MNNSNTTNRDILIARIERNYSKYRKDIIELDSDCVFDMASDIAVYADVYNEITKGDYLTEGDAAFLLQFVNPLRVLAEEWCCYKPHIEDDFDDFLNEFIGNGDTGEHMTLSVVNELREKYNTDLSVDEMCVLEILELGKQFLAGLCGSDINSNGKKGAEFCGKP